MSDKVAKAFEDFLRTRRDHRDGLTARQQLWTAFEAGAQFTLDEIRERTGLSQPTQETVPAPEASFVETFRRSPRRVQETPVARIPALPISADDEATVDGVVARRANECMTKVRQHFDERRAPETPAEPPRPDCEEWWHLKQYGYAPGGYIITCFDCKQKVWDCDKRASICRPCAEKRHSAANRRVEP